MKMKKRFLDILLSLVMALGLMPGMGLTAYAAGGGTEVTQANVICQQYSYMDAGDYSGGSIYDTPPVEITNITLADAQAFGAAVNCPTTYWVVVYAKDGDNLKWTSNGKTGEQTSTPRSASGRVLSAWFELYNDDVFHFGGNYDPYRDVTFYFSKGLATVSVTGVSLDKTTAQTIDVDGKVSFTATVSPDNATDKTVKWSVGGTDAGAVKLYSDEACTTEVGADAIDKLTVYAKGISAGTATVTVTATNGTDDTDDDKGTSCDVTVKILEATQPQTEASAPAAQAERITIPKKPAKVKAKTKKNSITVSWKKIKKNKKTKALRAMIKNIEVQYSTDPSFPKEATVTRIIKKNKTKLVLRGLTRKTLYYVRVRYVGADGVSNWKTKRVRTK